MTTPALIARMKRIDWTGDLPPCDICAGPGEFDAPLAQGPWANLCHEHLLTHGAETSVGFHRITDGTSHHPDCDGFRHSHVGFVVDVGPGLTRVWQPRCEHCDWEGSRRGDRDAAQSEAGQHTLAVPCDGRCTHWDD